MRMMYSEALVDHFEHPRHVGRLDASLSQVGTGSAGSMDTGGVLRIQIWVGEDGLIAETRFLAYGPPALIAAGSWVTEAVGGGTLAQAEAVDHKAIVAALDIPPARFYCALLAEDAVRAAIQEYKQKQRAYA